MWRRAAYSSQAPRSLRFAGGGPGARDGALAGATLAGGTPALARAIVAGAGAGAATTCAAGGGEVSPPEDEPDAAPELVALLSLDSGAVAGTGVGS